MPIFQYKCENCASVFEYLMTTSLTKHLACMSCGSSNVSRLDSTYFYPNKIFCPHDKDLDGEILKTQFAEIMADHSQSCGGCGTDGAPGKCKSETGKCRNCSCGKGGCGRK